MRADDFACRRGSGRWASRGRRRSGGGPAARFDACFNPDRINPDRFNPDRINPDRFNPDRDTAAGRL
jgi:hypothetical protein